MNNMNFEIRKMKESDRAEILSMMREFYTSDAVATNGSDEIFENDFNRCIDNSPYLEGFIIENNGTILGYSMIAKSFSTEFGKPCIWFEDLYLKQEFRGKGIIPKFMQFIEKTYNGAVFRLEAEKENGHACHIYKNLGFNSLPYKEFIKIFD